MSTTLLEPTVNREYSSLLTRTLPRVITTERQNKRYLTELESLLTDKDTRSKAETEIIGLLTLLIENFEAKQYATPKASPLEALNFLMDQHRVKQKDMLDVFGTKSIASEVISGKRGLNKEHIRRLSERFHVSPELFF